MKAADDNTAKTPAFKPLVASSRDLYASFSYLPEDLADVPSEAIDRLRWELVGWRDAGRFQEALGGLLGAHVAWPDEPGFSLEAVIIATRYLRVETRWSRGFIESLADPLRRSPEITLFSALLALDEGDEARAFRETSILMSSAREPEWAFLAEEQELLRQTVRRRATMAEPGDPDQASERHVFVRDGVDRYIRNAIGRGDFFDSLTGIVSVNIFGLADPHGYFSERLRALYDTLDADAKSVCLAYYISFKRFDEAAGVVADLMARPESATSVMFAKWAVYLASEIADGALERAVLERFRAPAASGFDLEGARAHEIELRRRAVTPARPARVFVGLFGQLREPDATLPHLVSTLSAGLAGAPDRFDVSYGLATWQATGGRSLTLDDITHFLLERLPAPVHALVANLAAPNARALAVDLPNLVDFILTHSAAGGQAVDREAIAAVMPAGTTILIDDDSEIDMAVAGLAAANGDVIDRGEVNQFKMMSRIKRLKDALGIAEWQAGGPMDAIVLMRPDLRFEGDLSALIERVLIRGAEQRIISDYDGNAEMIEGAGDRFLLGPRQAMVELFDMYDHFFEAFWPGSLNAVLQKRIGSHQNLRSFVFTRGLDLTTTSEIQYRLHRTVIDMADLIEPLTKDLQVGGRATSTIAAILGRTDG